MSEAVATARRMLESTGEHPVVSVFFDLDPSQFGTAPARATQWRSLLDSAERAGRADKSLPHAERTALNEDLRRLEDYLVSDDPPLSGARSLAVFCSSLDELFETVPLAQVTPPKVVIAPTPYVEPLVAGPGEDRTAVVLVSRRYGRILVGDLRRLEEEEKVADDVHGKHKRGGWSQANYQRSIENDAEQHFRHVAEELYRTWKQEPFSRLILGGPVEDVDRFAEDLHNDLRPALFPRRIDVDVERASLAEVHAAVRPLLEQARKAAQDAALDELQTRPGAGGAAVRGLAPTLNALAERRVETLLLALNFAASGVRCPRCGLLYPEGTDTCPADGVTPAPVADLREAAVESAVLQDASILVIGEGSDPPPPALHRGGGIAALLRF